MKSNKHKITIRKNKYKTTKNAKRKATHNNKATHNKTRRNKRRQMKGGDTPQTSIIKYINFFNKKQDDNKYADIEEYLNPIYGVIMNETGYIKNNYWLGQKNYLYNDEKSKRKVNEGLLTKEMKLVSEISRSIPPNIQPNIDVMREIRPSDIGKYVALLYYYNKTKDNKTFDELLKNKILNGKSVGFKRIFGRIKSNFDITQNKEFSKEMFHILLYCLWWVSGDMDGIKQYYEGINDIFKDVKIQAIDVEAGYKKYEEQKYEENSFEDIIGKLVKRDIKVINYEYAKTFCDENGKNTYPDCVETTMRNLINLLCFDGVKFDITKITSKLKNVNEKTIEYYKTFDTFNKQLSLNSTEKIYGKELNARDAWSDLIVHNANNNISFNSSCNDTSYNIKSGVKTMDGKKSNFFQLLQNVLSDDITEDNWKEKIQDINPQISFGSEYDDDVMKTGVGNIIIEYKTYTINFDFKVGHSFVEMKNNENTQYSTIHLHKYQQNYISYLENEIEYNKNDWVLWLNYTPELLTNIVNIHDNRNKSYVYKILELCSTELSNSDARSRTIINIIELPDFYKYIKHVDDSKNNIADDFIYESNDFKFIDNIPHLKVLKHRFDNKSKEEMKMFPDTSKLKNIEIIDSYFANNCKKLESIDLSGLTKLITIGRKFAYNCENLKIIHLSRLTNLKMIDYSFAETCKELKTIILSELPELETIRHSFAHHCKNVKSINLSGLTKLEVIGDEFAYGCVNLESIDLSGLTKLEIIGDDFASECKNIKTINVSGMRNDLIDFLRKKFSDAGEYPKFIIE